MKLMERLNSDSGAALSVEMIILIALAVFAALAVFSFILSPVQKSADSLGKGLSGWIDQLLSSKGQSGVPDFVPGAGSGTLGK